VELKWRVSITRDVNLLFNCMKYDLNDADMACMVRR